MKGYAVVGMLSFSMSFTLAMVNGTVFYKVIHNNTFLENCGSGPPFFPLGTKCPIASRSQVTRSVCWLAHHLETWGLVIL